MNAQTILDNLQGISDQFAQDRALRQRRRELVKSDFDQLKEAGFLLTGVPVEQGGIWESVARSTRPVCEILRTLAHGDSSVALVSSMHPAVLVFWLATSEVPDPFREAWAEQRRRVFQSAVDGHSWGTITSEPGSGGDIAKTRAIAQRVTESETENPGSSAAEYRLSGQKHFGSGSGITSFMITSAIPEGEAEPDLFYLDMRGVPWDGSRGVKLLAEWDGHGMIATQSHSMMFESFPATRIAWPGNIQKITDAQGGAIACYFAAVILGILETAIDVTRQRLERLLDSLRAYEQVEWVRVELEGWLARQAYEGMLRAVEEKGSAPRETLQGKTAIAELAESAMTRICRIMGGGTYNRYSPFGFWLEDVRALGFLRPPWGLAFEGLYRSSWSDTGFSFSGTRATNE